ncbi:MAG: tripartite tricarboxylate transporter substrate binding protein [Betaproteobacteria bacterium]|nr:tripartite tricarboxylate transporter substrate binding protein [Betaproteobacteria bacterium]
MIAEKLQRKQSAQCVANHPHYDPCLSGKIIHPALIAFATLLSFTPPFLMGTAQSQSYPAKPVRLLVPFPAAGPAEVMSRIVGKTLSEGLGQPLIIDVQGGGAGTIAMEAASRASADGYTLVVGSLSTLITGPILNPNVRYDPVKSFTPISMVAIGTSMLLINPGLPAKTLRELVDLAKAKPGTLNFGSNGTGALPHLAGELFKSITGVDIVHVPYKGAAPAALGLMAGEVHLIFIVPSGLEQHVRSGKLRALAAAGPKRIAAFPEVPTTAEAGLPSMETYTWFGLSGPQGLPGAVVARLNTEVTRVLAVKDVNEVLIKQGLEGGASSSEQFAKFIVSETAKWSKIIKTAGIKLEN